MCAVHHTIPSRRPKCRFLHAHLLPLPARLPARPPTHLPNKQTKVAELQAKAAEEAKAAAVRAGFGASGV